MRLISYIHNGKETVGVMSEDRQEVFPLRQFGIEAESMNELIEKYSVSELKALIKDEAKERISYSDVKRLSPIPVPKQDIICLGINYMTHAEESARYKKELFDGKRENAVYFSKRVNEAVPDGGDIPINDNVTDRLDYEAELAVIICKDCFNVKKEEAEEYIFGYTVLNDISARDIQTKHKQWYMGKSLTGACPIGPWIVTADEIGMDDDLKICSRVNGELRQDSHTGLMIFKIGEVIEELSSYAMLRSGTIISMGTPSGVGMGFQPPKFLKSGDVVECEVEKVGLLKNYVR